ncbi:NIPA-like protein 2 [Erysiphe neolycopersici]|uniref:NIPA-like protein 2 n=1 Tax=Erysiphe neolycopersici TaxID=212602 RepID=A0A420HRI5_9PEZI|nr:NIPA-like protein 2 [Erysiphe neolycopersici]
MHLQKHNNFFMTKLLLTDSSDKLYQIKTDNNEALQRWSSTIGIFTAIAGNILISFALNIQRLAHIKIHEKKANKILNSQFPESLTHVRSITHVDNIDQSEDDYYSYRESLTPQELLTSFEQSDKNNSRDKSYLCSPYWWIGIFLMTLGETGNFLAYGFAPASIVSPLGVVAIISNCVIAPILFKEKFRLRDFGGVTVAIAGAITVVMSAKQKEQKLGPHEIIGAIFQTEFKIYIAVTLCLIGILAWASPKYGGKIILIDLGLVGLLGGYTALSTKGLSSLLSSTLWRALTTPISYVLLLVLVGTAILQVRYLNKALQRFDSTQVIPVQYLTFTLSVIVGSTILYRDMDRISVENAIKFTGGCLLAFLGVWLITSGRPSNEDDDDNRHISIQKSLDEQLGVLNVDESLKSTSASIRGQDEVFVNSSNARKMKIPIENNIDSSRVYSYPSSRMFTNLTQTVDARGVFYETSPLLDKNQNSHPDGLLLRFSSVNERNFLVQSQNNEAQTSTTNPSGPHTISRPSLLRHARTLPNILESTKVEIPSTSNRVPVPRLKPGSFITSLSGGLSGATIDSFRRGINSSIRSRTLRNHYRYRRPNLNAASVFTTTNDSPKLSVTM